MFHDRYDRIRKATKPDTLNHSLGQRRHFPDIDVQTTLIDLKICTNLKDQ